MKKYTLLILFLILACINSGCLILTAKKGAEIISGKKKTKQEPIVEQTETKPKTVWIKYELLESEGTE